jgi:hypothetical protein
VGLYGQSGPTPMIALVVDLCGWMVTSFSLLLIPMLTTHLNIILFDYFGSTYFSLETLFCFFLFQIQPHPSTYHLASTYELTCPSPWPIFIVKIHIPLSFPWMNNVKYKFTFQYYMLKRNKWDIWFMDREINPTFIMSLNVLGHHNLFVTNDI